MSPSTEKILTFSPKHRSRGDYDRYPSGVPKWSNLDDIWLKDLAEGMREYLENCARRAALAIAGDAGGARRCFRNTRMSNLNAEKILK